MTREQVMQMVLEAKKLPFGVLMARLEMSERNWLVQRRMGIKESAWSSVQVLGDEMQGRLTGVYPRGSWQQVFGLKVK